MWPSGQPMTATFVFLQQNTERQTMKPLRVALLAVLSLAWAGACGAQQYPHKIVRVVVPFAPGAGTDLTARMLSRRLQETLGQTFLVDNRTGAGGMIAAEIVHKAAADGYTLLFGSAALAGNVALQPAATFNPLKDLQPISLISISPNLVLARADSPIQSVRGLVEYALKNPGKLNAGSAGNGTSTHLGIELLNQMAGIRITHVPFKGASPSLVALLSGDTELDFQGALSSLAAIRGGKVRALATGSVRRMAAAPEIPTMDSFFPGFETVNWFAFFAPVGTPAAIVDKLSAELRRSLKSPDVADGMARDGIEAIGSTPQELSAHLKREVERYVKFIKVANVRVQ